ncbi:hypothetical protein J8J04_02810 ['Fragaria x ananassa' phyllody phytoplasma]|uniref:Uncharacterized protein n=1 Tax='Fragaria x ananassa' phyllody phytoplasma TaxID=2358428 RepID=A0ABS5K3V7_9MOLU|nr:hypothetical protein ['Fragaria x ananassa' phyllody phytoplasma]MBS2126601.1 hypothetical protein ['Fragaria x ananassa' phyllody phytoplasma]
MISKTRKESLLKNKNFCNKMAKYADLDSTIFELEERGRFDSFYELVRSSKTLITKHLEKFLDKIDAKLEEFKDEIETKLFDLKIEIQKEYQLNDEEFEEICNADLY